MCCSSKPAGRQVAGKVDAKAHQLMMARRIQKFEVYLLGKGQVTPITVDVKVNDVPQTMKADTCAAVSVMSRQQQWKLFSQTQLHPSQVVLRTYTTERVAIVGVLPGCMAYKGHELSLVILCGIGSALFG